MGAIISFFTQNFIGKILTTLFVSMIPVIELRGAIPIGVGLGLPYLVSVVVSLIGNILPVPFIIVFIKAIFAWIRKVMPKLDGFVTKLEQRAEKNRATVEKYAFWGLFLFVAIPLPGTGAWTGALVAALLDIRMRHALPAILLGLIIAGVITTAVTMGVISLF